MATLCDYMMDTAIFYLEQYNIYISLEHASIDYQANISIQLLHQALHLGLCISKIKGYAGIKHLGRSKGREGQGSKIQGGRDRPRGPA